MANGMRLKMQLSGGRLSSSLWKSVCWFTHAYAVFHYGHGYCTASVPEKNQEIRRILFPSKSEQWTLCFGFVFLLFGLGLSAAFIIAYHCVHDCCDKSRSNALDTHTTTHQTQSASLCSPLALINKCMKWKEPQSKCQPLATPIPHVNGDKMALCVLLAFWALKGKNSTGQTQFRSFFRMNRRLNDAQNIFSTMCMQFNTEVKKTLLFK